MIDRGEKLSVKRQCELLERRRFHRHIALHGQQRRRLALPRGLDASLEELAAPKLLMPGEYLVRVHSMTPGNDGYRARDCSVSRAICRFSCTDHRLRMRTCLPPDPVPAHCSVEASTCSPRGHLRSCPLSASGHILLGPGFAAYAALATRLPHPAETNDCPRRSPTDRSCGGRRPPRPGTAAVCAFPEAGITPSTLQRCKCGSGFKRGVDCPLHSSAQSARVLEHAASHLPRHPIRLWTSRAPIRSTS